MPKILYDGFIECRCVECGQPIKTDQEYYTSRPKGARYTLYIHKKCYEALLPKPTDSGQTELSKAG